jgi:hypothetical protein
MGGYVLPMPSNSRTRPLSSRLALLAVASLVALALPATNALAAQPPVGLGTADSFGVLAGQTVTNTGPTTINGDLGVMPGSAIPGFPPGTVNGTIHAADAVALQAQSDLTTAYNDTAGRTPPALVSADLGGLTLTAGVYKAPGALGLTGALTLDAQGDPNSVFIFQAASTLTTASASRVNMINGAQPCNVFWQVGSSATFGTTSAFVGNVMALTSITLNDGVTLQGRALARNGAVTLINDTITAAHCATGGVLVADLAGELDVARALSADASVGANRGLRPNHAVEEALIEAGVDPTRATWGKSTWRKSTWGKSTWGKSTWRKSTWGKSTWKADDSFAAAWARTTWACATCRGE